MSVYKTSYKEIGAGGFTRIDGTIQFYGRVNALLDSTMIVVDFGAGRGLAGETASPYHRTLTNLKGKVREVIGVDVDKAVETNRRIDRAIVLATSSIPLQDTSVDLVVSDNTFEHVENPVQISSELKRILKPGGWICARTPYLYSALVVGASLIPNNLHAQVLRKVQPKTRADKDVFPTAYKLNSLNAIKRHFPSDEWEDFSYTWSSEPTYHFGSPLIARLWMIYQYLKLPFGGEYLFIFMRKR